MDQIVYYICIPLGWLMKLCWKMVSNYGVAILLFTLFTKIVLLPLSVWIQKNSIAMVKIQPQINFLKANYQGNIDLIADEQAKLFKKEHYHPMLTVIPLALQIVLLLGVVYIIYHPLNYLFGVSADTVQALAEAIGADPKSSSVQLQIIEAIQNGTLTATSAGGALGAATFDKIARFKMTFLGMNLSAVPSKEWGWYTLVPILAGASSFVMCFTQNLANVVQKEQGKINKYGIMLLSVGLSLYLGLGVPSGIALYWIARNLLSIAQMYALNAVIDPKKHVDYALLEESRTALEKARAFGKTDKKDPLYKQMKEREKKDYKRFKHIVNKHIVIYSERSGFYKYYKALIDELLARSNLTIHYITNDFNDAIFEVAEHEPRIKPYYIGLRKLSVLMMLMETDMFLMTTPDLNKYYLKRSYIKNDIEYVYVPHDSMSVHMSFREGAFDAFDTVLCTGPHTVKELRAIEDVYKLAPKNLVEFGFPLLDDLVDSVRAEQTDEPARQVKEILIAPSGQEDNLLDSCIDTLIEELYGDKYHITVRPHPEYVKRYGYQLQTLVDKYADRDPAKLTFELDFSTNRSIYTADVLFTDWSGVAAEFSFATLRPSVFVNTKMKVCNENWQKIGLTPVEMDIRDKIGVSVEKDALENIGRTVETLLSEREKYAEAIASYFQTFTFNHGTAAKKGAEYILKSLMRKKQAAQQKQTA